MATIAAPITPDQRAAQIAAVQAKNAEAQASARVAAVELCLSFRRAMIDDPTTAMERAELTGVMLAKLGRTYAFLQQQARTFDALIGV